MKMGGLPMRGMDHSLMSGRDEDGARERDGSMTRDDVVLSGEATDSDDGEMVDRIKRGVSPERRRMRWKNR